MNWVGHGAWSWPDPLSLLCHSLASHTPAVPPPFYKWVWNQANTVIESHKARQSSSYQSLTQFVCGHYSTFIASECNPCLANLMCSTIKSGCVIVWEVVITFVMTGLKWCRHWWETIIGFAWPNENTVTLTQRSHMQLGSCMVLTTLACKSLMIEVALCNSVCGITLQLHYCLTQERSISQPTWRCTESVTL